MKRSFLYFAAFSLLIFAAGCGAASEDPSRSNTNHVAEKTVTATPEPDSGPEAGGGSIAENEPAELVADLYKQHDAQKGPFFQNDRSRVDKYFAKAFADLIHRDNVDPLEPTRALGADPLYDGQDFEIKKFAVGKAEIKDANATVHVTFENFGEKKTVTFSLILENNAWKISDIKYDHGASLLAILKEEYGDGKTNAPPVKNVAGKFEGTYRVGETTCAVTQTSAGVDVRWAKGSGVEKYAFEGRDGTGYNYVAEAEGGKYNVFTFKNESYDSGVFTRADGKVFNVSRAK
ncbi:MAG: DUF3828 domain-containing protein [Acidobacteria bacterium]|nr:DUF3828 domain-containing protein [Acidobacteriota bacterium]